MRLGYSQAIITPLLTRPVYLAGFGNNRLATAIHDDLFVRSLSLDSGDVPVVLCALDLIGLFRRDVQEVIRLVQHRAPAAAVVIASTHTHHGPDTLGFWGPDSKTSGVDAAYMADLKTTITETILSSLSALQPVAFKTTSVPVLGLVKNARDPEIVDNELTLAQFLDDTQAPLMTLLNFACHPEVLWEHNPTITSDYVGYLRTEVENQTGAPGIFFSGALGGMMTPDVKDHSFAEAEFIGRKLAQEGLKALAAVRSEREAKVSRQTREIQAKLTNMLYKIAFQRKLLPDVRVNGRVTTEVSLIKIGGLWIATVPGELLPKLGLALKAQLRDAGAQVAGVIGLANDELGYILPVEDFRFPLTPFKPGKHYEETNSIGKDITPQVMDGLRSLLHQTGA